MLYLSFNINKKDIILFCRFSWDECFWGCCFGSLSAQGFTIFSNELYLQIVCFIWAIYLLFWTLCLWMIGICFLWLFWNGRAFSTLKMLCFNGCKYYDISLSFSCSTSKEIGKKCLLDYWNGMVSFILHSTSAKAHWQQYYLSIWQSISALPSSVFQSDTLSSCT